MKTKLDFTKLYTKYNNKNQTLQNCKLNITIKTKLYKTVN